MEISAQMVKELRESTGAGMMDCKKALVETDGDMEKAVDLLREKGLGKVYQIGDNPIVGICPERSEFKTITGFSPLRLSGLSILDGVKTCAVGVIFCIRPIADDKNLDILK